MTRRPALLMATAALLLGTASDALAHRLNVFAATDCETVTIEASFSSGRVPATGEVRILDGENTLLLTRALGEDGTLILPLAELDATRGLLIEVEAGDHADYWIMTSDDIAAKCRS